MACYEQQKFREQDYVFQEEKLTEVYKFEGSLLASCA